VISLLTSRTRRLFFIFFVPHHVLISVLVDSLCFAILFIFAGGALGPGTLFAPWSEVWLPDNFAVGPPMNGVVGLGWMLVLLVSFVRGARES
jgi:hypothetical protein